MNPFDSPQQPQHPYQAPAPQQYQHMPQPQPQYQQPEMPQPPFDTQSDTLRPVAVVKVLSPVGVEYVFLTIALLIGGSALAGALLALVNGGANFGSLAFPVATLVVTVPTFALIFLHLKRLELRSPHLRLDPSKRRSTQATQIITFVVCLFTLIGFFAAAFASLGSGIDGISLGKAALDALCVLVVAGGILFYYWRDEHASKY